MNKLLQLCTKAQRSVSASLSRDLVPRKRTFGIPDGSVGGINLGQTTSAGVLPSGTTAPKKKRLVNYQTLWTLANTDPVTWGIIRTVRTLINQTPWDIVPDLDEKFRELDRWYDQACDCINDWGYAVEFDSSLLDPDLLGKITSEIKGVIKGGAKGEQSVREKRYQLETLFRVTKRELEQKAVVNAAAVRRIFQQPNRHWEKSLRALQEIVLKDLLINDSGVICHNYDVYGNLAELYTVPGWQIVPIAYPDLTVPQPPLAAYYWDDGGNVKGFFTNRQLTYIMENPQGDGYGMSPVEALVYVIIGTMLGDSNIINNLKDGNLAPMIINLKGVTPGQRLHFESELYTQLDKTHGVRPLVLSGAPTDDGEIQIAQIARGVDFQKTCAMEYMKFAPGIKAFVFGFEQEDLGLISDSNAGKASDAEVAAALRDRRAITGRLTLLEEYYNAEIVRQEFPFTDVKFCFERRRHIANVLQQEQAWAVAVASGSMSRNEVRRQRAKYGLADQRPIPGGDVPTITTGNALVQVDFLEPADGDDDQDASMDGGEGGVVRAGGVVQPVATGEVKKRNNANERTQKQGAKITK